MTKSILCDYRRIGIYKEGKENLRGSLILVQDEYNHYWDDIQL